MKKISRKYVQNVCQSAADAVMRTPQSPAEIGEWLAPLIERLKSAEDWGESETWNDEKKESSVTPKLGVHAMTEADACPVSEFFKFHAENNSNRNREERDSLAEKNKSILERLDKEQTRRVELEGTNIELEHKLEAVIKMARQCGLKISI